METTMLKKFLSLTLIAAIFFIQADVQAEAQAEAQVLDQKNDQTNAQPTVPAVTSPVPLQEPEPANLAQVLKPGVATIAAGTILEFGFVNPLSSATAKVGDDVPLRLLRPLMAGDKTLLAEGTIVHGRVTKASPAGPNCKSGTVEWTIDRLSFPDGSTVKTFHRFPETDAKLRIPYRNQFRPEDTNRFATAATYVLLAPLTVIGGAIIVVFLVLAGPFFLGDIFTEHRHPACTTPGKDISWPSTTRVGVEVNKKHTVRF
jgi:hypothetical protein